jgi:hypothetical protein
VRASFSSRATQLDSGQTTQRVLEALLTRSGLDRSELEILANQRRTEANELAARRLAKADQQFSAFLETVKRDINNWRNNVEQLAIFFPPPVQRFLLNTASDVSATSGIPISSSSLAPGNNWVQFLFVTFQETPEFNSSNEEVSFSFFWQNPSNVTATIDVDAYLILTRLLQLVATGGYVEGGFCYIAVRAELHIHELWNQPPTSPVFQSGQASLRRQT